jgi:outer membrane protein assembly factor BamB
MRARSLILWLALVTAAHAAPVGWRSNGTGVFPDATPPVALSKGFQVAWQLDTPGWSNATPVLAGDLVLITAEPTRLIALNQHTGKIAWQADHAVLDALSAAERAPIAAKVTAADAAEVELQAARTAYSTLQREARRAPSDASLSARLAAASAALDALKRSIDEAAAYRTPPDKEIIGYASATPVSDGVHVWASFGNGVVACYTLAGQRVWARWLGPPSNDMRGYAFGQTASPQLIGGTLLVPSGELHALDAKTGATRWKGGAYNDYGTPAVGTIDGVDVVITPQGVLHRARDGAVLAKGLGDLVYIGPTLIGRDVYFVGTSSIQHRDVTGAVTASAWQLSGDGAGGVKTSRRWQVVLPTGQALYAPPVVHDGLIYAVTKRAELHVLDARDGASVYLQRLGDALPGDVFPAPTIAGSYLFLYSASGIGLSLRPGRSFHEFARTDVGPMRATPLFQGERVYLRTLDRLFVFDGGLPIGPQP